MNWFKKEQKVVSEQVYSLNKQYSERKISRQEYNEGISQALLEVFIPQDVLNLLNKHSIDIFNVEKDKMPKCDLNQAIRLAQTARVATKGVSCLFDIVKKRAAHKDPAADKFSVRYQNVQVIPVSEWTTIYNQVSTQAFPVSQCTVEGMWESFCIDAKSLTLLVPMVANKYGEMIAGHASFDCDA